MADDSDLEKSEQPTDSKLKKAKEEGQIPRSRELTSIVLLLIGLATMWLFGSTMTSNLTTIMKQGMIVAQQSSDEKLMLFNFTRLIKAGF